MQHRDGQQQPQPPAAARPTAQPGRAEASSSMGEVSPVRAKHEHAREGAGAVGLSDVASEWRAPGIAPSVGGLPPPPALNSAPQDQAAQSSQGDAVHLDRHAEGSMQQPMTFSAPTFGANSACTGNTTEQFPGSQLGRTAELCAGAEGAAAGSWTATPTCSAAPGTSGILVKDLISEGGLDILAHNFSTSACVFHGHSMNAAFHAMLSLEQALGKVIDSDRKGGISVSEASLLRLTGPAPTLLVSLEPSWPVGAPDQPSAPAAAALTPPASKQRQAEYAEPVADWPSTATSAVPLPPQASAERERATPALAPPTAPAVCTFSASSSQQDAAAGDGVTLDNAHGQHWRAEAEAEPATTTQGGITAAASRSVEARLKTIGEPPPSAHRAALGSPAAAQHMPAAGSDVSGAQAVGPRAQEQQGGRLLPEVGSAVGAPTRLFEARHSPSSARDAAPAWQPQPAPLSSVPDAAAPQQRGTVMRASPAEPGLMDLEHAALGPVCPAGECASAEPPAAVSAPLLLQVASTGDAASSMHGGCAPDTEASSGIMHIAAGAGKLRSLADFAAPGAAADERVQYSGVPANPLTVAAHSEAQGGGRLGSLAGDTAVMLLIILFASTGVSC